MNYAETIKKNTGIILILIIAAALRLYHLNFQSLWMDEIYTMNVSNPNTSFGDMISEVNSREGFPYLYFFIIKIFLHLFGYTAIAARLFSAIMGIAGVFMMYKLGKQLYSKNTGLIAAALVAVSEYCIYVSQDARPYTFYFFGVILCFYFMVVFIKNISLRNAVIYGLSAGLLLNINFISLVNLFSQSIIIFGFILVSPASERLRFFKYALLSGIIALVMFVPNILILIKLMGFTTTWIPAPTSDSVSLIFRELLGNSEMTLFIFSPLFIYFLIKSFKARNTQTYEEIISNKKAFGFIILMPWVSICILVILLKSYTDSSLMISRYFVSTLPVFFLVFAAGIGYIRNKIIGMSVLACLVVFMLVNNVVVKQYYRVPGKTQFREAAAFVIDNNKKNEPVYTGVKYWFDYFFVGKANYEIVEKPTFEAFVGEMIANPSKVKAFWYVEAHGRPFVLSESAQQFIDTHFFIENSYKGLDAWGRHYVLLGDAPKTVDFSKFKELKPQNGDPFEMNIEALENKDNVVTVVGWVYFPGQAATDSKAEILLVKDGIITRLDSEKVFRDDVTTYFKSEFDLSNSGFSATINTAELQKGTYTLAVYLKNNSTQKEGLTMTNKTIEIK